MKQSLEVFARKNGLLFETTRTTEESRMFPTSKSGTVRGAKKSVKWVCKLAPPILARQLRVRRRNGVITLAPSAAQTLKEARKGLIDSVSGGVLEYSNIFDRECGDDPKIKVPANLR